MSKRLISVVVAFLLCALGTGTANAATWSSSDKWGSWSNGGYTVRNNIWGSGAGSQRISADSYRKWTVRANHPNTGGVKSYPHVAKAVNTRISSIGSLRSSFNVSVPRSGAYATAYDIWLGTGLSYGWVKGTVDEAIAKRRGEGWQAELVGGIELPRELRVRLFVQGTLTFPLYSLRDMYRSRDSVLYVYAAEASLGIRF